MNLAHITYQVSENLFSVNDLSKIGEIPVSEAKIFEKIMGLNYVPRDSKITGVIQLSNIVEKLLREYSLNTKKVKYLLCAHTSDYISPWGVNSLENIIGKFQFSEATFFGSTVHKCAGGFHLLQLSEKLFRALDDTDYILLLIADISFTEILHYIPGSTILGDAATAVLLKKLSPYHRFIDAQLETYGQFAKGIWSERNEQHLFQSIYITCLTKLIEKVVKFNKLTLSKIKCIFPHNVNKISWKQIIQTLSLSSEQVYFENIARTAHCFGSDPFFNLKDGISEGRIIPGDYYLLVTMGLGATFGVALFQY
ncbi:MAG: hypothetical protein NTU49_02800 [Gammaproteobacteria bacterium]|nr:hypothetical protein [Gammaproteobacteria bacterium]